LKRLRWAVFAPVAAMLLLLVSCGGGGVANNPTPAILQLTPTSVIAGSDGFPLFISGTGFISNSNGVSFAYWNGAPRSTNFNSGSGQIVVWVLTSDVATAGVAQVTVVNPEPGGGPASVARTFTIRPAQAGAPTISNFAPANVAAGGQAFKLTVNGSNFALGDFIVWNGGQRITTFVSSNQLTTEIDAVNIADPGFASVSVGTSNPAISSVSLAYQITGPSNPKPSVGSLSPPGIFIDSPDSQVTLAGSGFVPGSMADWQAGGPSVPLATAYFSSSRIVVLIPAAELTTAGSGQITVTNPAPGGGSSSPINFAIVYPVPTIGSLSPSSATAGGSAFTLTVNGTNFTEASVVSFNGTAKPTTFMNSSQLTAAISAADIAASGTANVTVTNPTPGGGSSTAQSFKIN
jgi:hypothetical protein